VPATMSKPPPTASIKRCDGKSDLYALQRAQLQRRNKPNGVEDDRYREDVSPNRQSPRKYSSKDAGEEHGRPRIGKIDKGATPERMSTHRWAFFGRAFASPLRCPRACRIKGQHVPTAQPGGSGPGGPDTPSDVGRCKHNRVRS
jgi:hypothetical protein